MMCEKCGKEVSACSCLMDSYRMVYQDLLKKRDVLKTGLTSLEEMLATKALEPVVKEEGIMLNMDLKTAGEIGLFEWLRSKGFEVAKSFRGSGNPLLKGDPKK